jgi:hypothetical protein
VDSNHIPRALYAHKTLVTRPFQDPMFLDIGILYQKNGHLQPLTQRILTFIQETAKLSLQAEHNENNPSK